MWDLLSWLFFLVFIAALAVVGALLLRGYLATGSVSSSISNTFFGPKPDKRLEVIDHASVDGRRRLLLIRRDDVEHLIMTGGPVDVVIETGIAIEQKRPRSVAELQEAVVAAAPLQSTAVFSRPARAFGQAIGEK